MRRLVWRLFGGHQLPSAARDLMCVPWTPWRCRYCRKAD